MIEFRGSSYERSRSLADLAKRIGLAEENEQTETHPFHLDHEGWSLVLFRSEIPLTKEDRGTADNQTPSAQKAATKVWPYPIYIRASSSSNNLVIGAASTEIVKAFLSQMRSKMNSFISSVYLDVDRLADAILDSTQPKFCLTHMTLDVPNYGTALKTMQLHGDDIALAVELRDFLKKYRTRLVGLRRNDRIAEDAVLGSNGFLKFYDDRINGVAYCLAFVQEMGLYEG